MTSFSDKLDEMWEEFGLESWTNKAEANAYILDLFEREVIGEDQEPPEGHNANCYCYDNENQLRAEMRAKLRGLDQTAKEADN